MSGAMISHVPLDLVGAGFAVVEAEVGGQRIGVLIDMGDFAPYPVLVTPDLAARLNLKPKSPTRCLHASLGNGPVCFKPVSLPFRLGDIAAVGDQAAVSPQVGQMAARFGERFEAVVGGEFFKSHRLTIDYRRRLLAFDGPVPKTRSLTFRTLPAPAIVADGKVNGAASFRFLIDTAAADTIVNPSVAQKARMSIGGPTWVYGVGGSIRGATSTNNQICLAGRCRSGLTVKLARLPRRIDLLGTSIGGVLGVRFLAGGKLTIDYPRHRIWLEP
jgi:predicted aspartyl protease